MNFLLNMINAILIFLPLQSVFMIVLNMTKCNDFVIPSLVLFFVTILVNVFFKLIKNGALFFLSGILLVILCAFSTSGGERIATIIFACLLVGMKIFERLKNKQIHGYGEMMMIAFGILGIVIVATGTKEMISACVISAVVYIVLKYVFEGLSNTHDFLEINQKIAELPEKTIKRKTRITMLPFLLIILVCVVVGINSGLGEIIVALFFVLANFLKGIFARERVEVDVEKSEEMVFEHLKDLKMDRLFEDFGERRMAPAMIEPIIKIILSVVAVIIAIFLLRALFILLKDLIKALYENKNADEESELIIGEEKEFLSFKKARTLFSKMKDSLPNNAKIRRLYKKHILGNKDFDISKNYTPLEISKRLNIDSSRADEKIRNLYEKARYSKTECTSDEVSQMKSFLKEFSKE